MTSPQLSGANPRETSRAAADSSFTGKLVFKSSGHEEGKLHYPNRPENPLTAVIPFKPAEYGPDDVLMISKAHKLMFQLYDKHTRNSGPNEALPLAHHASECGLLLSLARYRWQTVVAGIFHDLLEGYVTFKYRKSAEDVCKIVAQQFGPEIIPMIEAASEPGRWDPDVSWRQRKTAALEKVLQHGSECAAVSCAAKISTLRVGNTYLRKNGSIAGWSQGSYSDNIDMFRQFGEAYNQKLVALILLDLYQTELKLFERGGIIIQ